MLEGKGTAEHEEILGKLLEFAESGTVEFRYSYIHIVEAAATAKAHVERATYRAKAIQLLSVTKALAPYMQLPAIEAAALVKGETVKPPRDRPTLHARTDAGLWFPSFQATFEELSESVAAMMNDPVAAFEQQEGMKLGRKFRRLAKGTKSRKALPSILRNGLTTMWPSFAARMREQFPMSPQTEMQWKDMILHAGSAQYAIDASNALARDLSDLAGVMPWLTLTSSSGLSGLPKWLRGSGEDYVATLDKLREKAEEIRLLSKKLGDASIPWEVGLAQVKERVEQRLFEEAVKGFTEKDAEIFTSLAVSPESALEAAMTTGPRGFPSVHIQAELAIANMKVNVTPSQTPRSLQKAKSDLGDMAHAWYIPYVDVMRVDAFAGGYMSAPSALYGTKLVTKLEELPIVLASAQQIGNL